MKKSFYSLCTLLVLFTFYILFGCAKQIPGGSNDTGNGLKPLKLTQVSTAPGILGKAIAASGNKVLFARVDSAGNQGNPMVTIHIWDSKTDQWSVQTLSEQRFDFSVTTAGEKVYIAGGIKGSFNLGFTASSKIDIYNVTDNSWSVAELSKPRFKIACAALGDRVFFAGGFTDPYDSKNVSSTLDIIDNNNQMSSSTLNFARGAMSATTAWVNIYFAGGYNENGVSNEINIYDGGNNSWSVSHLQEPRAEMASIEAGGEIFWAGGINTLNDNESGLVETRNFSTGHSRFASLGKARKNFTAVSDGSKILFGPAENVNGIDQVFDIYDLASNIWISGVSPTEITSIIQLYTTIYGVSYYGGKSLWKIEFTW